MLLLSGGEPVLFPGAAGQPLLDELDNVVIQGTRVGFLLRHSQFRQHVEYGARLHFQLARQLVDPLLHRQDAEISLNERRRLV